MGVPVVIGAKGVERIVEIKLNPDEKKKFQHSVNAVKGLIKVVERIESKANAEAQKNSPKKTAFKKKPPKKKKK